ncbi:hypothetical protein FD967_02100 [Polynucleobacter sp. JS-Mosq-20-D10]|uniref:hypothetical protein n=1 Tax=Polynucleobacter sp. JS-Mosq-20-D10 TaxID=2576922 RepID=UPI001BFD36FD|nr:hypothetical protein [Polynucleobacter sp. JS-Mosq-20-D10]QWE00860.1 hypothetical protein FD967_02100 [Polynucleobacter sp. JS-Mosq-20-D10]
MKTPLLLGLFVLLVASGGLFYSYYTRDLPECKDEYIQILLNQEIRNNEALIQDSRTLAFNDISEMSHRNGARICSTNLLTTQGAYSVGYQVVNQVMVKDTIWQRLTGPTDYSVKIEYVRKAKRD